MKIQKILIISIIIFAAIFTSISLFSRSKTGWESIQIGRLKYKVGDWYSNPSSLTNLMKFFGKTVNCVTPKRELFVSLLDESFKKVPIIYFTGHGKIKFSDKEKENLRWYLRNGGFLFADDNFGMDKYIRKELNNLFAGEKLIEIPLNHSVYKRPYKMPTGIPKIHRHYGGPPIAFGLFLEGKMVAFYGYNTDLGDGWEDLDVHKDGPAKHRAALKMGTNVLWYAVNSGLD